MSDIEGMAGLLRAAVDEVRRLRSANETAVALLEGIERASMPSASRDALRNVMAAVHPEHAVTRLGNHDVLWLHVVPTYKVGELTEAALKVLRGAQ